MTQTVSLIQNIWTKNWETICCVILTKTSQRMIVNLLMMVLIDYQSSSSSVNITSVAMFVLYDIWVVFLLIEIISPAKLQIIVHFFVLKHEEHSATLTQNLKTIYIYNKNKFFFSPIYFVGAPGFLPQLWKLLRPKRLMPLQLPGMKRVKNHILLTRQVLFLIMCKFWRACHLEVTVPVGWA